LDIEFIKVLTQSTDHKKAANEVLETLGVDDPILAIAKN
jgi:hypothetical protein